MDISWEMTNRSSQSLIVPSDIGLEATFAAITVTDDRNRQQSFRPYVIICERARLNELAPGAALNASAKVFWSSSGFAFLRPGRYRVTVAVGWSAQGIPVGVQRDLDVFVEYPTNQTDNQAADQVFHTEVGKWVALGGNAYHLADAVDRLRALSGSTFDTTPRLLAGFEGLLPDPPRRTRRRR